MVASTGGCACVAYIGIGISVDEWHGSHGACGRRRRRRTGIQNISIGVIERECTGLLDRRLRKDRRRHRHESSVTAPNVFNMLIVYAPCLVLMCCEVPQNTARNVVRIEKASCELIKRPLATLRIFRRDCSSEASGLR
jgi:hypothetical protein